MTLSSRRLFEAVRWQPCHARATDRDIRKAISCARSEIARSMAHARKVLSGTDGEWPARIKDECRNDLERTDLQCFAGYFAHPPFQCPFCGSLDYMGYSEDHTIEEMNGWAAYYAESILMKRTVFCFDCADLSQLQHAMHAADIAMMHAAERNRELESEARLLNDLLKTTEEKIHAGYRQHPKEASETVD